jgi:hypothetical protein
MKIEHTLRERLFLVMEQHGYTLPELAEALNVSENELEREFSNEELSISLSEAISKELYHCHI